MRDALTFNQKLNPSTTHANVVVGKNFCVAQPNAQVAHNTNGAISLYAFVDNDTDFANIVHKNLYLSSLNVNESVIDNVINHVLINKTKIIIDTARTLEEVGKFDVKHGMSPVQYIHSLGLLPHCLVAGGVYLDKDDIDLMVQENAELILTPSFDAGSGNGIAAFKLYKNRGVKMHLGTMNGAFNVSHSIAFEKEVLRLSVNGTMCSEFAVTDNDLKMLG